MMTFEDWCAQSRQMPKNRAPKWVPLCPVPTSTLPAPFRSAPPAKVEVSLSAPLRPFEFDGDD